MATVDPQAYYWTDEWQEAERESDDSRSAGEGRIFGGASAAINYLLDDDAGD